MFLHLIDGTSLMTTLPAVIVGVVLAVARIVKNLPKDTIGKFFEHRTTKYQIIANDSKGRVAAMQKQRLVFLGFLLTCRVVVSLVLINSNNHPTEPPKDIPTVRNRH
ncbi:hypothetical protein ABT278_17625 [Streptomyces sp. NPDC001228]|uniref:hypothetical protein n=1 Tax=Streptomyces sp. NPDC001228 TaxID=3154381 RepID=UPI003332AB9F